MPVSEWLEETKRLNLSLSELTEFIRLCKESDHNIYYKLKGNFATSKASILHSKWYTKEYLDTSDKRRNKLILQFTKKYGNSDLANSFGVGFTAAWTILNKDIDEGLIKKH